MATQRRAKVKEAIDEISAFRKLGREIGPKEVHRSAYGTGVMQDLQEKYGVNADTLRKAVQFADPVDGYTKPEFDKLCESIEAGQSDQADNKPIFRKTHVIRLLSVKPKRLRRKLQLRAIKKAWSTSELEAEIARECGTRRAGGRRRQIPQDKGAFLTQIEGMCETWRRWHKEVVRDETDCPLNELSKQLQRRIHDGTKCLRELQKMVARELTTLQPDRESRQISKRDADSTAER